MEVEGDDRLLVIAPNFLWEESRNSRNILKPFKGISRRGIPYTKSYVKQPPLPMKCRLGVFNVQNRKIIFGPRTGQITDAGQNFKMQIFISVSFTKY